MRPFAIVGANYGNDAGIAGPRAVNVNNAASNANANIGSRQSYQIRKTFTSAGKSPPLGENQSDRAELSSIAERLRGDKRNET